MEYLSAKDMAKKWNITERQVQQLCADKRIIGVKRIGRTWLIPEDAYKPEDLRKRIRK
ncbi:MAG: Helix-turn-helix domain protein [Firmicutes bacterium ADurb.Bin193]|nr:MAG: Helix-turn-helix domain protein [Firmicutes bacterium ADurb.Bin193]